MHAFGGLVAFPAPDRIPTVHMAAALDLLAWEVRQDAVIAAARGPTRGAPTGMHAGPAGPLGMSQPGTVHDLVYCLYVIVL